MESAYLLLQRAAVGAVDTAATQAEWVTFAYWALGALLTAASACGVALRSAIIWVATNLIMPHVKANASMLKSIEDYMVISKEAFPNLSEMIDNKLEAVRHEIRENRLVCQKIQSEPHIPERPKLKGGPAHA